jgi:hypothetical protein
VKHIDAYNAKELKGQIMIFRRAEKLNIKITFYIYFNAGYLVHKPFFLAGPYTTI